METPPDKEKKDESIVERDQTLDELVAVLFFEFVFCRMISIVYLLLIFMMPTIIALYFL